MRNQEVTYSNSRVFESSSESQNPIRPDETQGPREVGHTVFQYNQEKHELQKNLNNLNQSYITLQNNSCLNKTLRNKSRECDNFKHQKEMDSLNIKQNRCCGETKVGLDCTQRTEFNVHKELLNTISLCMISGVDNLHYSGANTIFKTGEHVEGHWFCCGIKCYYFIKDNKRWNGCKLTCHDCSLSLLKIEDDDELKFLQLQINPNNYWIGLKYDERNRKWQWIDDVPSKLNLTTVKSLKENEGCAYFSFQDIQPDDCGRNHPCVCEKKMDKFPDSVNSMKERPQSAEKTRQ